MLPRPFTGRAARLRSPSCPGFDRRRVGVHRTLRFRGVPTVAVALRGRPWSAVVADMIEGVVAANGLQGVKADQARAALWLAVDDSGELAPPETLDQSTAVVRDDAAAPCRAARVAELADSGA